MRRSGLLTVATAGPAILVCMGEHANGDEAAMYNYRNFDAWVAALGSLPAGAGLHVAAAR